MISDAPVEVTAISNSIITINSPVFPINLWATRGATKPIADDQNLNGLLIG